jgi:peroxiredoxin
MNRKMIPVAILLILGCVRAEQRADVPPKAEAPAGSRSLDVRLPRPAAEADAAYLGLEGSTGPFRMDQIRARVLVVEVFDMYCRFCQRAAPDVNAVYELSLKSALGKDVKMIGIGRTNTALEVSTFKENYEVRFPLFADRDLSITRALEAHDEGTPHFIVIRLDPGNGATVVHRSTGVFEDPEAFFQAILERCGLRKE